MTRSISRNTTNIKIEIDVLVTVLERKNLLALGRLKFKCKTLFKYNRRNAQKLIDVWLQRNRGRFEMTPAKQNRILLFLALYNKNNVVL